MISPVPAHAASPSTVIERTAQAAASLAQVYNPRQAQGADAASSTDTWTASVPSPSGGTAVVRITIDYSSVANPDWVSHGSACSSTEIEDDSTGAVSA
jgi:hypothetical protein